ncbi:MAG: NADH-quinone oxidoreductase subunit NuoE [Anaerolineales bacterium]|nr:NADH-quinone oxidoreductase subunit NuoE [Anaerolineales bacterium]
MLSEEERQELDKEIKHYEFDRAACIEGLKILQRHRGGWISDESIKDLAEYLNMSPEQVDNVATFYNLIYRKPVGRNVILLCDSISCWVLGYENVLNNLQERLGIGLGETTEDGEFTLLPMACLGACERAPAMMIGEQLYHNLTPEKLDQILEGYKSSQPVTGAVGESNGKTTQ